MPDYIVVKDGSPTDARYQLPPSLEEEYDEILEDIYFGRPVVHKLKEFMLDHPAYPQAGNMLAAVYLSSGKLPQAWEVNEKLLDRFPDYPSAVLFKAKFLLDADRLEELEAFVDLQKDFGEQFPGRHRVEFSELAEYESVAIEWLLANAENSLAFSRINTILRMMEDFKTELPFCDRIFDAIDAFLPEEEMLPESRVILENLARCQLGLPLRPPFHHPEINLLYQQLEEKDIPALMALLNLPRKTLLIDLRAAIRDGIRNFQFFHHYYENEEIDLVILGFLLLAALREPGDLKEWLQFLDSEEELVDGWLGDWLGQLMFVVGWQLGRDDLPQMAAALRRSYRFDWASPNLVNSLLLVILHEPDKEKEVLDIWEDTLHWIIRDNAKGADISPYLADTILEYACALDMERFRPLLDQAYARGDIDKDFYGSKEVFLRDTRDRSELMQGFEFTTSVQSLEQWLQHIIKGFN
ncbi:tetratricopeptide repeat protein [Flavihumibacter stibioxidans]|nr:hypothetical protein [Flavihumibacter stibioxidans]